MLLLVRLVGLLERAERRVLANERRPNREGLRPPRGRVDLRRETR